MVELKEIELSRIRPNRLNPRLGINIEKLNELADSIKQVGLLEPLIIRPIDNEYEVVVGERRYRASQQAGLKTVPAIIRNFTDEQVIELNLIENIQREDLNAVEKGNCCKQLLTKYPEKYPSKEVIGKKIGVSSGTVNNWLKLTKAPVEIQKMITPPEKVGVPRELGKLDYSTALTITQLIEEPTRQIEVAKEIASKPVHGRKARRVIAKAAKEPEKPIEEIMEEIIEEPCELTFTAANKEPILKGLQTQITRTTPPDLEIKAGKIAYATVLEPHFADLRVISVERKRLKYFTEKDAKAEGNYTLKEFRDSWREKHGEWNENQLVYIIRFEKI
ncbi:MAG: ParB/RepB/Spo0J family partition protein [Candidatus Bathyarchaeota archaeon]|nr:ParB/RepB/Spo0J family partition protein [Candidatus Bathyarchaeota archaeon]MDH5494173.1 ParB/RepB/Spo0J family partition protein [Candidatus Bathyarchaeota archaeon]